MISHACRIVLLGCVMPQTLYKTVVAIHGISALHDFVFVFACRKSTFVLLSVNKSHCYAI